MYVTYAVVHKLSWIVAMYRQFLKKKVVAEPFTFLCFALRLSKARLACIRCAVSSSTLYLRIFWAKNRRLLFGCPGRIPLVAHERKIGSIFPRDPSIQIMPTLGLRVCKYYLHWAIWIPRAVAHRFRTTSQAELIPERSTPETNKTCLERTPAFQNA